MADYGLRVKNASGTVILNITDRITRWKWNSSQTASSGNSGALSEINGLQTCEFAIPVGAWGSRDNIPHDISRSGNTLTWTARTLSPFFYPATCIIFCFAYT
jgi:hypothetical protein